MKAVNPLSFITKQAGGRDHDSAAKEQEAHMIIGRCPSKS